MVLFSAVGLAQSRGADAVTQPGRIASSEEIADAVHPAALLPLRILSFPYQAVMGGIEHGLIAFERHKIRERARLWTEELHRRGVDLRFGGSGEGTGIGGAVAYRIRTGATHSIGLLGLITAKRYQEVGLHWMLAAGISRLVAESSYQWRPEENFYGLGHRSSHEKHSQFALR
jgi:hypothetical protein